MLLLRINGIPTGVVQTGEDLFNHPQLKHLGHYQILNHKVIGLYSYDTSSFILPKTLGKSELAVPLTGEHSKHVYQHILGMSDEVIAELVVD